MQSPPRILVIGSHEGLIPEPVWAKFTSRYNVCMYSFPTTKDFHEALQSGTHSDVAGIVRLGLNIPVGIDKVAQGWTKRALPYFPPSLRLIVNFGHGYDEEDVPGLNAKGIHFLNTTGGSEATAAVGLYLVISVFRQLSRYERMLRNDEFLPGLRHSAKNASDPFGKAIGIVGMGSIGQALAKHTSGLGMEIHALDRPNLRVLMSERHNGQGLPQIHLHDSIESLVETVDCTVLTCSYSPATHHLLSREVFGKMKKGARIVNIARGKCIDEIALCDAIESGIVAGVGLDVYYDE
ncbi:hypothetical protein NQ176_g1913 [Zarea fungicola]|uniref:Uncharacterized protein n=1 Tax=Zarea fungicola TaxID=93591 RepID=A0ACC1NT27_9HYPO|nr:hypothetical protein NQ176_g1913 [Lecanicillium fungicola]